MYGRDADDTLDWIQEKEGVVSAEDYGHDLESVQSLMSKHEGFEVCCKTNESVFTLLSTTCMRKDNSDL